MAIAESISASTSVIKLLEPTGRDGRLVTYYGDEEWWQTLNGMLAAAASDDILGDCATVDFSAWA